MRILLIEDESDAAAVLATGLRENAYAVDIGSDGRTDWNLRPRTTTT